MKVHLLYRDRDFAMPEEPPFGYETLEEDLRLGEMIKVMGGDDPFLRDVARAALMQPLDAPEDILYRQAVVRDSVKNKDVVRKLYDVVSDALGRQRKGWWWFGKSQQPSAMFSNAVGSLHMLLEVLRSIRQMAEQSIGGFQSEGFTNLLNMLMEELGDDYLGEIGQHLEDLKFKNGILISARLGEYAQGVDYVLRRKERKGFWRRWAFVPSYTIILGDVNGDEDISRRRERAIDNINNAMVQSAEHVLQFLDTLQRELAFCLGCIHLEKALGDRGQPIGYPAPLPMGSAVREFRDLRDISIALRSGAHAIGNDLAQRGIRLSIITGANQGGKTTFLRSFGQAQVMMQCGMFVCAQEYRAHICAGVYTHFKKEEDRRYQSGKLDEELGRMSRIVDHLRPGALVLFNESFASTNEREGAEINRQIVGALTDGGVEVVTVSHLYTFTEGVRQRNAQDVMFLAAERLEDGRRTFHILPGQPLETAYGEDLFNKVFAPART